MHLAYLYQIKTLLTFELDVDSTIIGSLLKTTNNKKKNNQIWILEN